MYRMHRNYFLIIHISEMDLGCVWKLPMLKLWSREADLLNRAVLELTGSDFCDAGKSLIEFACGIAM